PPSGPGCGRVGPRRPPTTWPSAPRPGPRPAGSRRSGGCSMRPESCSTPIWVALRSPERRRRRSRRWRPATRIWSSTSRPGAAAPAAILRVHPSNFRIAGFTARPELAELSALAHARRAFLIEDLGSGALVDLAAFGLEREPTVRDSLTAGCDIVTFSGDKLAGASQAGLVLGRRRLVERIRRDPLARAVRVDKLQLAALEATLPSWSDPERAAREIPVLAMLAT